MNYEAHTSHEWWRDSCFFNLKISQKRVWNERWDENKSVDTKKNSGNGQLQGCYWPPLWCLAAKGVSPKAFLAANQKPSILKALQPREVIPVIQTLLIAEVQKRHENVTRPAPGVSAHVVNINPFWSWHNFSDNWRHRIQRRFTSPIRLLLCALCGFSFGLSGCAPN